MVNFALLFLFVFCWSVIKLLAGDDLFQLLGRSEILFLVLEGLNYKCTLW